MTEEEEQSEILAEDPTVPDEPVDYAAGGWCTPSETLYDIPLITARRGGISFTVAPNVGTMTKKQLRERVTNLEKSLARTRDALRKVQRRSRKLERRNRGLLKIVGKVAR